MWEGSHHLRGYRFGRLWLRFLTVPVVQRSVRGLDCATDLGAVDDERGISCLSLRAQVRRILVHGVSVLAIVGGQASPGVGLGVLVTSPPAEKHPKSRFPDVPGGPPRRPGDVRDVTC